MFQRKPLAREMPGFLEEAERARFRRQDAAMEMTRQDLLAMRERLSQITERNRQLMALRRELMAERRRHRPTGGRPTRS